MYSIINMAKLTVQEAKNLIEEKVKKLSDKKATWLRYYNLYKGQAWWSENLYEGSKRNDVDNQIFPLIQSLTGYLQKISIVDRVTPPSKNDPIERKIASYFEGAIEDFWWFNQRRAGLQKWFRNSLIKGNTYGFIMVDPNADYPYILETIGPENIVKASDKISNLQDQPWIARITSTNHSYLKDLLKEDKDLLNKLAYNHPDKDSDIEIWDFWSKQTRQNFLITNSGLKILGRDWPYKKLNLYPFFDLQDISVLGSSDAISTVQMLYTLQRSYDKQKIQIKENAEFMGNPPIVVDVESGIDTSKIEGKPRLIIRKYRDGEFRIVPVPPLPGYVERQPDRTRENMERVAAWNDMVGSGRSSGQREKGAVSLLMSASFTSLDPKLRNLEAALNDANQILIGLLQEFSYSAKKALSFRRASSFEGFSPSDISGKYLSDVDIKGLEPERERLRAQEIAMFYKLGIIGRRKALEELGEKNPDQVIKDYEEEQKKLLEFEKEKAEYIERQRAVSASPSEQPSAVGDVPNPEAGKPTPIDQAQVQQNKETSIENEEQKDVKYIDYLGNILLPALRSKLEGMKFRKKKNF